MRRKLPPKPALVMNTNSNGRSQVNDSKSILAGHGLSRREFVKIASSLTVIASMNSAFAERSPFAVQTGVGDYYLSQRDPNWTQILALSTSLDPVKLGNPDRHVAIYAYELTLDGSFSRPGKDVF